MFCSQNYIYAIYELIYILYIWKMESKIIPVMIGALGTITPKLEK